MTWCNSREEQLVTLLKMRHDAISAPELAAILVTTDRQVRALINHLRKDHHLPICSSPQEGFYWPRTRRSANHTIASLRGRVNDIQAVIYGIETGMGHMFEQQSLFEEAS